MDTGNGAQSFDVALSGGWNDGRKDAGLTPVAAAEPQPIALPLVILVCSHRSQIKARSLPITVVSFVPHGTVASSNVSPPSWSESLAL